MKQPCYSFLFIFCLFLQTLTSGCQNCKEEICKNGGHCDWNSCACPYNTFGDNCQEAAPIGFALKDIRVIQKPQLVSDIQNHPDEEYQLVITIKTDAQHLVREIALNQKQSAIMKVSSQPSIMQFAPESFQAYSDMSSYLKGQSIGVDVGFEYFYFDEDCQKGNLQQGAIRHFAIPLNHLYREGARDFKYLFREEIDRAGGSLEFVLEGTWIL